MKKIKKKSEVIINWNLNEKSWKNLDFDPIKVGEEVILNTLDYLAIRYFLPDCELSVLLTSDSEIQNLNKQFRGLDKPTNVLSFPPELPIQNLEELYLGDIAISLQTLTNESTLQKKTIQDHYCHLLIHSVLHLIGHDHEDEEEAILMESIEKTVLSILNIRDPYE